MNFEWDWEKTCGLLIKRKEPFLHFLISLGAMTTWNQAINLPSGSPTVILNSSLLSATDLHEILKHDA
jgi:hypothetical protein